VVDTPFFARRNHPYDRSRPVPIPADDVAGAILDCLRYGRPEAIVPAWLTVPARIHSLVPRTYQALAHRFT
jgi:hypothetical protein